MREVEKANLDRLSERSISMHKRLVAVLILTLFLLTTLPALASITIRNRTDFKLDIVTRDTRRGQNISIPPDERLSIQTEAGGGQLIVYKKGEEVARKSYDDGDKFEIKVENDKIVIKKVNDL